MFYKVDNGELLMAKTLHFPDGAVTETDPKSAKAASHGWATFKDEEEARVALKCPVREPEPLLEV